MLKVNNKYYPYPFYITSTFQSQEELVKLRDQQIVDRKYGRSQNLAGLVFKADNVVDDDVIVKALDQKYNTLLDKLLLESLKKQMGEFNRLKTMF